jgi:hypothetical protein
MSTTTLVNLDIPKDREDALSSTAPTPRRTSVETIRDEEKLAPVQDDVDQPEPLSKVRLSLLIMGLTLSIFLVALDFVSIL